MTNPVFSRRLPSPDSDSGSRDFASVAGGAPDTLDLTLTNPTRAGLAYPVREIGEALAREQIGKYEPQPLGLRSARQVLSRQWELRGAHVDPDDVVLTASTSEAYGLLFKLFCDPGDEVLVPEPSYPLFDVLARLEGVRAVPYRHGYDGSWYLDLDSLRAARSTRTRAVVAVSPNNPTGAFLKPSEALAIADLGLPLIADEVFWPYDFRTEPDPRSVALEHGGDLVVVLDGLSKRCGMPQLKLGWMTLAGLPSLVDKARARLELINDSYLSAGTPVQVALGDLMRVGRGVQAQIRRRCVANLTTLASACAGTAVSVLALEGGWSACLRLPALFSDEAWASSLSTEAGVLTQPGWLFDFREGTYLVLSLLVAEPEFRTGAERLVHHVEAKL